MRAPVDVFQRTNSASALSPPTDLPEVAAAAESSLTAAAATASPSPAMLERLLPEQRSKFLRLWDSLLAHLRGIAVDLHSPEWTPVTIEPPGDVLL